MDKGDTLSKLTPTNLSAMAGTGLEALSYRLRTELGCEAWHWNPNGTWSDPARKQGYWTSSSKPGNVYPLSWGYRLPRRGNTIDQANDDGYSRIDDGDTSTYWKSNPYLDPHFTREPESRHPQWVTVDFQDLEPVDAIRIHWANPFATRFRVEYWVGENDLEPEDAPNGHWVSFPMGTAKVDRPGEATYRLGARVNVRYYRLNLLASSHTAESSKHHDLRDSLGYAIREMDLGVIHNGEFKGAVEHERSHEQTHIFTSSTDPWHRATDRDLTVEQPSFDFVFNRRINHNEGIMAPLGILYNTPDDVLAEVQWLRAKGYPVRMFELGEEPDGQHAKATDFASLYAQVARRIRSVDRSVLLGGPCLQTIETDSAQWCDNRSDKGWMALFQDELRALREEQNLQFFSFEWYPFDLSYLPSQPQLRTAMSLFTTYLARMQREGVPATLPWLISEYGYSAFAGPSDVQVQAGLLNLDTVGTFLSWGGSGAYLYGGFPDELISEKKGHWGNLMTWLIDDDGNAHFPLATYWAARLITQYWCPQSNQTQLLLDCHTTADSNLGCYAVKRPDGNIAVLLVNRSAEISRGLKLNVKGMAVRSGKLSFWGSEQYSWPNVQPNSHPAKSVPPSTRPFVGEIHLPPYSAAVVVFRSPESSIQKAR
jgi:hypothetical protein